MFNEHLSKLSNDLKIDIYERAFGEHVNINEQSQVDLYFYSSLFSNVNVIDDLYDLRIEKCYFSVMVCLICRDKLDISCCNYYDMFIESCLLSKKCTEILKLMTSLMHNIYYCYYTGDVYKLYDNTLTNNYKNSETCDDYIDYENCNVVLKTNDLPTHFNSILKKTSKIFHSNLDINTRILKLIYNHNMFESTYIPISNTLFENQVYTDKITYVIHHKLWKICELFTNGKLSCITKYIPKTYIINLISSCNTDLDLSVFLDKYDSGTNVCDVLFREYIPAHPNIIFKFNDVELYKVDYICEKYLDVAKKKAGNIVATIITHTKNQHNIINYNVALMFLTNPRILNSDMFKVDINEFIRCLVYKKISKNIESDLWTRLSPEIYKKLDSIKISFSDKVRLHFYVIFDVPISIIVLHNAIATNLDKSYGNVFIDRLIQPDKIIHQIDCLNMLLERDTEKTDYVKNFLKSNSHLYTIELLKTVSVKIHSIHDVIIDIICKKCEQQNQPNNKFICCICITNTVEYSSTCGHSVCSDCFSQNPQSKCPICNNKNYKKNAHKLY